MRESVRKERFCGSCGSHNAFDYPERVFCGKRLSEGLDPVVQTLWCCKEWNPAAQQCFCVREASENCKAKMDSKG